MWTLIIISHILMFVSFMMLTISIIQGLFFYNDFNELKLENFSIYSVLVYVFTQTLVLFLIITINKEIKKLISNLSVSVDCKKYSICLF